MIATGGKNHWAGIVEKEMAKQPQSVNSRQGEKMKRKLADITLTHTDIANLL